MATNSTIGRVYKPKATPEIEKFRKQINRLSTEDYADLCIAAKVPRNSGWRFKVGRTLEMSGVRMLSMQSAFIRLQAKKTRQATRAAA